MLYLYSIIFAIVQALTEFWPVSSSGHLIISHHFFDFKSLDSLTFDVALHVGTAFALIIYFWKDIAKYFRVFIQMFASFNLADEDKKTVLNLAIATLPAIAAGILLEMYIEVYFRNILVVGATLLVGGIIILIVEKYSRKQNDFQTLSIPESFIIGCAQALALIPGVSRSGATIITGMILKLKRSEAAKFSFLLSIPIVLGAGVKKLFDVNFDVITKSEVYLFIVGMIVAFIVGFIVIKYFLKFLQKRSLAVFAWYRVLLGLVVLIYFISCIY